MFLSTEIRSYHQGSGVLWSTTSKTIYRRERISTDVRSVFMLGKDRDILRSKSILDKEAIVPLVFQVVDVELGFPGQRIYHGWQVACCLERQD